MSLSLPRAAVQFKFRTPLFQGKPFQHFQRCSTKRFAAAIALATVAFSGRPADASEGVGKALQSRFWWVDLGSGFTSKPVGYLYMFGTQSTPDAEGWYRGTRVTFQGVQWAGEGTRLGFAWKPTANGVIIDHASRRETVQFINWYPAPHEVLVVSGLQLTSFMLTTRSPYCPETIRRNYWR